MQKYLNPIWTSKDKLRVALAITLLELFVYTKREYNSQFVEIFELSQPSKTSKYSDSLMVFVVPEELRNKNASHHRLTSHQTNISDINYFVKHQHFNFGDCVDTCFNTIFCFGFHYLPQSGDCHLLNYTSNYELSRAKGLGDDLLYLADIDEQLALGKYVRLSIYDSKRIASWEVRRRTLYVNEMGWR